MKVFWSEKHLLHTPQWYVADGTVRQCPEVAARVDPILAALKGAHDLVELVDRNPLGLVERVHDGGYLEYLQKVHAEWFNEFQCDVLPDTFVRRPGVQRPNKTVAQAGWYCFDMAAPITQGTCEAALDAARLAISAADAAVKLPGHRGAYALCRPPGHHAGRDYCGGFCYLNNAAIAAEHLLAAGSKRVAILDVDYHHGNGTQDIFYQRNDVLFVSLHADPNMQYPYFWGHAQERGAGPGEGFNVNLPLARGATSAQWFKALDIGLTRIAAFPAEALLVSLGVDAHAADGVGDFNLTVEDFRNIGEKIALLKLPTVFVQEGGYNLQTIGPCVAAVLGGFEEN